MDNERHATEFDGVMKRLIGDDRPPLLHLGWAPGGYSNTCRECDEIFTGDKRASMCADCAYDIEEGGTTPGLLPDPGRQIRPHIPGGGGILVLDDDVVLNRVAGMMSLLGSEAYAITNTRSDLFDRPAIRSRVIRPPAPERHKDEHDYRRIAKAEETRQRRNAKRLRDMRR